MTAMPSAPALIHVLPAPPLAPLDWLALLHPVLAILFLYPVVGATIRLAILVRERRLEINPIAATVPVEHADHGRWVGSGMVVLVLLALLWSVLANPLEPAAAAGAIGRVLPLLPLAALVLGCCLALWRLRSAPLRLAAALLCWLALLLLGSGPQVWRQADTPLDPAFWSSHYWSGLLLCGLLLSGMAAGPAIAASPTLRRLHTGVALLSALLLAVVAITGCRDLLAMRLL
jgi:hypothetical protein